jgi:hypothetical protein
MPRTTLCALVLLPWPLLPACGDAGDGGDTEAAATDATADPTVSDAGSSGVDPSTTAGTGVTATATATATDPTDPTVGDTSSAGDDSSGGSDDTASVDPDAIAVAVGYGTRRVRSVDGLTWTDFVEVNPNGGDDDDLLRGVGYGDGVFVAVGGGGAGFSMRSADGITWTDENHSLGSFLSDVVVLADGTFVAVGGNGLRVRSVDGGVTWIDPSEYFAGHHRAIAAGNGVAVAVGHTYGDSNVGLVTTTTDGATWTEFQIGGSGYSGGSITFGNGTFVARANDGQLRASADGVAWTDADVTTSGGERRPVFGDDVFWIGSDDGYWTSSDGLQWTPYASDQVRDPVIWFHGQYLALGWPASIAASSDLTAWQTVFEPGGSGLTDVAIGVPGT